ncbi:hypothetical protein [Mycobacterium sp. 1245801.1]|uniref:hypothetical protein n=1 Tax=Mycobacterium sp. 1245801.1 TaxID=1834075 RepID=UPI0007FE1FB2|nr:hypothetical protein [Mycobacterium sp. 1245801.1]OBJ24623.1 hypothetical protein A5622_11645 [Mycobacterium sp. 1245801.1]
MSRIYTNAVPRDGRGRPLIYPKPGRGKTHADVVAKFAKDKKRPPSYRRTTKFIDVLEDSYNIDRWEKRLTVLGMASRPDLVEAAAARTADSLDRQALNRIAAQALAHMRPHLKAAIGSYLHHCTELEDRGEPRSALPSPAEYASLADEDLIDSDYPQDIRDSDLDAYQTAKARYGLRYTSIEQMRVFDPWQVAGTPDRTGTGTDPRFGGKYMILDVKTGDIDWADEQRTIAMQFALYARSTAYDHDTGRHKDIPPLCLRRAAVIHLPAGQAKCELHFVDILRGWTGCQRAQANWEWRKEKGLFTRIDEWEPPTHLDKLALNPTYDEAAVNAPSVDALRELWMKAANHPGALSDSFKAAVKQRLAQLEAQANTEGALI